MTLITLATLSLTLVTLPVSIYAAFASRRTSARFLSKRLDEHSERLKDLEEGSETLRAALQREKARNNMRALRASRKPTDPDADPLANGSGAPLDAEAAKDEWTRRANLAIARGEIKTLGRR